MWKQYIRWTCKRTFDSYTLWISYKRKTVLKREKKPTIVWLHLILLETFCWQYRSYTNIHIKAFHDNIPDASSSYRITWVQVCICHVDIPAKFLVFPKNAWNTVLSDNAVVPGFILKEMKIESHLVILYMFQR